MRYENVFLHAILADEVGHAFWADAGVEACIFVEGSAGYNAWWEL